ncbi:hypothetical protein [Flammeovirga aprica]|uniref:Uncharacterized protein n=1 Tax=Flammeovirga aprica JL-4 TaxID=694437 RepID=A0A7X9RYI0_9BACT|nr:hypothetical protein [Flammeovirga aprica]NME71048.1 hypothetical protein [Flammeovirga aprica JL-4]
MKAFMIILASLFLLLFLVVRAIKAKRKPESKLSIYEHPSFFVKPSIEMTVKSVPKDENDKENIDFDSMFDDNDKK